MRFPLYYSSVTLEMRIGYSGNATFSAKLQTSFISYKLFPQLISPLTFQPPSATTQEAFTTPVSTFADFSWGCLHQYRNPKIHNGILLPTQVSSSSTTTKASAISATCLKLFFLPPISNRYFSSTRTSPTGGSDSL